jgi:hypothetical protein
MIRFLPGLILIQIATLALAYAAFESDFETNILMVLAGICLLFAFFMALWFTTIARQLHENRLHRVQRSHAREREKIRVDAEKQKAKIMADSQREIERRTSRAYARANFRAGLAFAVVVGVGALLILTQFITAGLLTFAAGGGAVFGYAARLRQEMRARSRSTGEGSALIKHKETRGQPRLDDEPPGSRSRVTEKQIREE